ncbi:hypothetical protein RKD48_002155 [Streptomyces ambofaciens]
MFDEGDQGVAAVLFVAGVQLEDGDGPTEGHGVADFVGGVSVAAVEVVDGDHEGQLTVSSTRRW